MTLDEFTVELQAHDWFYDWSDDGTVFRKGNANDGRLQNIARTNGPEYARAFDDEWFKHFRPPHFDTKRESAPMVKAGLYKLE